MNEEQFDNWNERKKSLNKVKLIRRVSAKKIYWLSIGLNIGAEVYGKNEFFTRPVLVINSFYNGTFLAFL
ncbi:hypothetical protein FWB53_00600 [Campylobacter jejuni]|nr:hypothetical protein [Campylobacter jejuni]EDP6004000.1 hypothetical protein [Campylobacter jejuni]